MSRPVFRVRRAGHHWAVFRGNHRVSPLLSSQYLAENALERIARKSRVRVRRCMTCAAPFESEGPHNRMCKSCRESAGGQAYALHVPGETT